MRICLKILLCCNRKADWLDGLLNVLSDHWHKVPSTVLEHIRSTIAPDLLPPPLLESTPTHLKSLDGFLRRILRAKDWHQLKQAEAVLDKLLQSQRPVTTVANVLQNVPFTKGLSKYLVYLFAVFSHIAIKEGAHNKANTIMRERLQARKQSNANLPSLL